jgi:predicted O-methyltransferase YrrM
MNSEQIRTLARMAVELTAIGMREPLDIYAYSKTPYYKFLYLLSATGQFPRMVELGSFIGVGALHLAAGNPRGTVWTIDRERETWQVDLDAYKLPNIARIIGDTCNDNAVRYGAYENIDLLFIDADHTPAAVMRDYDFWRPRVRSGGLILFDDRKWEGNTSAWDQNVASEPDAQAIELDELHEPFGFGAIILGGQP